MSRFQDNHITKVAIVGSAGRIGGAFTKALLGTGKHTVTAITRKGSSSKMPEGCKVVEIDYDDENSIVQALEGQEVFITTLSVQAPKDTQSKLIAAAAKANVPYIFHNAFGADTTGTHVTDDTGLGPAERAARKQIEELGVSKWIGFTCGFWYEWSLPMGKEMYGFDFNTREVEFFDDGETKFDTSTWPQCGRGMALLLSLPVQGEGTTLDSFANSQVFVHSFQVTQKEIFASVLRVTGEKESDWKIKYEPAMERVKNGRERMKNGDRLGWGQMLYSRTLAKDGNCNFDGKLCNEKLGLKDEDLDEWTKFCVDFSRAGRSWWTE